MASTLRLTEVGGPKRFLGSAALKMQMVKDQEHKHHLGVPKEGKVSGPTPHLQNQGWAWGIAAICVLTRLLGDSEAH